MRALSLVGLAILSGTAIVSTTAFTPAYAASLGSCSGNIGTLSGTGGLSSSGFIGADSCEKSLAGNDSEADVESLFTGDWTRAFKTNSPKSNSDDVTTQGNLAVGYGSDGTGTSATQIGTWLISDLSNDVTSFILGIKAGNGNQPESQSLLYYKFDDLSVLSGDWSTFGLKNNGGNQPNMSHISVYTNSDGVPSAVPTPALLPGLISMGVAAMRKRRNEGEALQ